MKIKNNILEINKNILSINGIRNVHENLTLFSTEEENDKLLSCFKGGVIKNFLIEENAYNEFLHNVSEKLRKSKKEFEFTSFYSYIIGSFSWYETKEGHDFWSKINSKYERYLKDNALVRL